MENLGSFNSHYSLFLAKVLAPLKALAVLPNLPTQSQTTVPRENKGWGGGNQCAKSSLGSVARPCGLPLLAVQLNILHLPLHVTPSSNGGGRGKLAC